MHGIQWPTQAAPVALRLLQRRHLLIGSVDILVHPWRRKIHSEIREVGCPRSSGKHHQQSQQRASIASYWNHAEANKGFSLYCCCQLAQKESVILTPYNNSCLLMVQGPVVQL